jgi:hypothetical protein
LGCQAFACSERQTEIAGPSSVAAIVSYVDIPSMARIGDWHAAGNAVTPNLDLSSLTARRRRIIERKSR